MEAPAGPLTSRQHAGARVEKPPESGGARSEGARSPPVDISDIKPIDVPGLVAFWLLAVIVFLQFFTRYVLNNSLGWTEEVARYVLILVGFLGAVTCARKGTHIFLEFFYRYLSAGVAKAMSIIAELVTLVFYGSMTWLAVRLALTTRQKMISINVPRSVVYWIVALALAAMTVQSALWLIRKFRQRGEEIVASIEERTLVE